VIFGPLLFLEEGASLDCLGSLDSNFYPSVSELVAQWIPMILGYLLSFDTSRSSLNLRISSEWVRYLLFVKNCAFPKQSLSNQPYSAGHICDIKFSIDNGECNEVCFFSSW
jgi:hypothetical protein